MSKSTSSIQSYVVSAVTKPPEVVASHADTRCEYPASFMRIRCCAAITLGRYPSGRGGACRLITKTALGSTALLLSG